MKSINKKKKIALCPWCNENLFEVDIIEVVFSKNNTLIWYSDYANIVNSNIVTYDSYILCNKCRKSINITASELSGHYERNEPLKKLEKRI